MSASHGQARHFRSRASATAKAGAIMRPEIRVSVARPAARQARPYRAFSKKKTAARVRAIASDSVAPVER